MNVLNEYRYARTWRTCPRCHGSGTQTNWATVQSRTCEVCGGEGRARFTRWTAFRVAMGWWSEAIVYSLTHEPHYVNRPAAEVSQEGKER